MSKSNDNFSKLSTNPACFSQNFQRQRLISKLVFPFFLSFHFKFQDLTRIVKKEFEKRDNTPNFMFRAQLALGSGASTFNVYYQNSTNHEVGGERLKNQRIKLLFSKLFKFVLNFYKKFCSYIDNHYLKLPFLIGNIFFPLERSRHHSSLHDISGRLQCLYH